MYVCVCVCVSVYVCVHVSQRFNGVTIYLYICDCVYVS